MIKWPKIPSFRGYEDEISAFWENSGETACRISCENITELLLNNSWLNILKQCEFGNNWHDWSVKTLLTVVLV